jgi:hypothetical protein
MVAPFYRGKFVAGAFLAGLLLAGTSSAKRFYDDDPIQHEPKPMNVEDARRRKLSDYYDFFLNSFAHPGERNTKTRKIPAQAVNTLGDVPDSSWYTKRHYWRPMTIEELVRGPGNQTPPSPDGPWQVVAAKAEGITPGFMIRDSRGEHYLLKFDPLSNPEMSTSADVLVSKIFYAVGYSVPENYIVSFSRDNLTIGEDVTLRDTRGKLRKMTSRDVTELLLRVPTDKNGMYRAGASRILQGKSLGEFRYHGTRKDDPNDIVPHEHRRDLRGLSVFCAWVDHDDSRAINTLDLLVEERGIQFVKHHLIDFGSTLGSASDRANSPRAGFEYLFEWKPAIEQFFTFGLLVPKWARAKYPDIPAVGRFEAKVFDPVTWVPEYPNPAFSNRLPDDAFWAAKQVMAFTDEQIRAIVKTGAYSDPRAEKWIADCLIARRDKIGRAFFAQVLPLDRFKIQDGRLVFEDLAVEHKFISSRNYKVQWSSFDNDTESKTVLPGETTFNVPKDMVDGAFLAAEIGAGVPKKTVTVYVRIRTGHVEVVGLDRTW